MDSNNLMQALYAMDRERIKAELNAGANVNAHYNKHGWTPFMWACREFYEPEAIKAFGKFMIEYFIDDCFSFIF